MNELVCRRLVGALVFVLGTAAPVIAAPMTSAQKRDERREDAAVRKAQDAVNEAQQAVRTAEGEQKTAEGKLREAAARRKAAAGALRKTLDRLEAEHADTTGLTAVRRSLKEAQAEFDLKARPVREALRKDADFRAAEAAVSRAEESLKGAEDPSDRETPLKERLAATNRLRELEDAAFRRDEVLRTLKDRVERSQAAVRQANERFERAVERDEALRAARKEFDSAQAAEERAEKAAATQARDLAAARDKLARATRQLQQKKLEDRRDDNRGTKR